MASMFSKPKMPEYIIPPTPPSPAATDTAAKEAAAREAEKIKKKRLTAGTMFTGPQGLTEAPTVLKEKLGQ